MVIKQSVVLIGSIVTIDVAGFAGAQVALGLAESCQARMLDLS